VIDHRTGRLTREEGDELLFLAGEATGTARETALVICEARGDEDAATRLKIRQATDTSRDAWRRFQARVRELIREA
jgi:hypothetical protein